MSETLITVELDSKERHRLSGQVEVTTEPTDKPSGRDEISRRVSLMIG